MHHQPKPSLNQMMSCDLFDANPLYEPLLHYCQLDIESTFIQIVLKIPTLWFKKMHLEMSSGKWWPLYLWLNVLINMLFSKCINGLVQERCKSIANALELRLSCTNPSILNMYLFFGVSFNANCHCSAWEWYENKPISICENHSTETD